MKKTKDRKPFTFYDGPPFATGLPHYGHICAGTIKVRLFCYYKLQKDIVCRYACFKGHFVDRRFGWDCHGLPVEYEIDKKLGIKTKKDFEKIGVEKYNKECRKIVMRYSHQWEDIVGRFGRWIDFKRDYKTLDLSFMETVWYCFKQMYK